MSEETDPRVVAALASGQWKEHVAPNGRKFYRHVVTKKPVWNLAKELAAMAAQEDKNPAAATPGSPTTTSVIPENERQERIARAKKRQEEESQLNAAISQLERQKTKLETEIAILQGPVEADAAAVEELSHLLANRRAGVEQVSGEVAARRKEKHTQLQALLAKIQRLEATKESEAVHHAELSARHDRLNAETLELKADLLREQASAEALRASVTAARQRVEQVKQQLARAQRETEQKRQLVLDVEQQVRLASDTKFEAEKRVLALQGRLELLNAELAQRKAMSFAQQEAARNASGEVHESELISSLLQKVHQKKKLLKQLRERATREEHVEDMTEQAIQLRRVIHDAKRDRAHLRKLCDGMEEQVKSTESFVTELKQYLATLNALPQ